ncbi:MAG: CARDB domain-containing protein [Candidatus Paceibacterota bacterium]
MNAMKNETQNKSARNQFIIGIAILVILIIGVGGVLLVKSSDTLSQAVERSVAAITSLFTGSEESLEVVLDSQSITSGDETTITFNHISPSSTDGAYAVAFGCTTGAEYSISPDSVFLTEESEVRCGSYYRIKDAEMPLTASITSSVNDAIQVPVYVSYFDGSTIVVRGESLLTVQKVLATNTDQNPENSSTTEENTNTEPTIPTNSQSSQTTTPTEEPSAGSQTEVITQINTTSETSAPTGGNPDLVAKLLDVGVLNKLTNEYTATSTYSRSDRIGIRFEVINEGGSRANNWYFSAILPTYPVYIYTSDTQQALNPGEKIEFTIGFDQVTAGDKTVTINVDPGKQVNGDNFDNNQIIVNLETQN